METAEETEVRKETGRDGDGECYLSRDILGNVSGGLWASLLHFNEIWEAEFFSPGLKKKKTQLTLSVWSF